MHERVMRFINRFTQGGKNKGTIETFTCGCCYWFAYILFKRFYVSDEWGQVELMYDQIENHFGCLIEGVVYDITGDVTDKYKWEKWGKIAEADELLTKRILRDCVFF